MMQTQQFGEEIIKGEREPAGWLFKYWGGDNEIQVRHVRVGNR